MKRNRVKNNKTSIDERTCYFGHENIFGDMFKGDDYWGNNFWQSANWNFRSYLLYRDWLRGLALNRIKYENLPETCNARFMEFTLLNQGVACICQPKKSSENFDKNSFYSTQVALNSPPNIYNDYSEWISIGNNGWQFESDIDNGTLIWNTQERLPILSQIDLFARRLAYCDRVADSNGKAQMNPVIVTGDQRQTQVMINMVKQIAGGEPYIIGNKEMSNTEISALNLSVPYIAENVMMVKQQIMAEFYTFIGVQNTPRKSERMIEEEVAGYTEPVVMSRLNALTPRREACDYLNKKFGLNIKVYWNDDLLSKNYYAKNDIQKKSEIDKESKSESGNNEEDK